jgi:hypothetical protein
MLWWIAIDDVYNRSEPHRAQHIGRLFSEVDVVPQDVHLERTTLADAAVPEDHPPIKTAQEAMVALEVARAAWARVHDQLSLEL